MITWLELTTVLDRPIAFHRIFATVGGGAIPGLFLSQAFYWTSRVKNPEGWFYKTQKEWTEETALTRSEQELARKKLKALKILEEKKCGLPCKLYFRVNKEVLCQAIDGASGQSLSIEEFIKIYDSVLLGLSNSHLARAKRLGVEREYVDYREVIKRYGLKCHICQQPIKKGIGNRGEHLVFDHFIPLSNGGTHACDNIFPAHALCNSAKKDKLPEQTRMSQQDKQECPNRTNTNVPIGQAVATNWDKQSIYTEITPEITSETTSPLTPQGEQGKDGEESNPEEDGKKQEARDNTQAYSLAGKLETQIEQRSRLINPESKDSASRRENDSHFQQCDNSAFVGHGQLAPDGKQRPYNQMKGCYRSVGSDPWMQSSRNPLPEFKKWVYEQAIADGRKYSEANAAAEIRNDCDRAEDLWEKYQQYRQPRSTPRYEVVTGPLPKPVPLIDRDPELRKKAEETLQNLRKNAK